MENTIKTKLVILHDKIVAMNPDIIKFEFGCEIKQGDTWYKIIGTTPSGHPITIKRDGPGIFDSTKSEGAHIDKFEGLTYVLGRPIRLADVLIALGKEKTVHLKTMGEYVRLSDEHTGVEFWDITDDDLSHQSEDTINFLYGILK